MIIFVLIKVRNFLFTKNKIKMAQDCKYINSKVWKKLKDHHVVSDISLNTKNAYFFFIGHVKYFEIADNLRIALKKYYNKNVEIIFLLPGFPPSYFKENFAVINPLLKNFSLKNKFVQSCELNPYRLNKAVSECSYVDNLVKHVLEHQKDVFFCAFNNSLELTLHKRFKNSVLIGPDPHVFDKCDKKLFQHEVADTLGIPQAKWFMVHNKQDLVQLYTKNFNNKPAFVSKLSSAGGKGCAIVYSKDELESHPHVDKNLCRYLIAEKLDVKSSPCGEAVVANEKEVFYFCTSDQMLDGPKYLGTVYPAKLSGVQKKKIEEYTVKLGKYLGRQGFRGIFGVDFIVDRRGKIFFAEINPRICGSTNEKINMHEVTKDKEMPSIMELVFLATMKNTFGFLKQRKIKKAGFSWGVRSYLAGKGTLILKKVIPEYSEKIAFKKLKTTILDFPLKNTVFLKEGKLCKVVCVKKTRKQVEEEIKKADKIVNSCFIKKDSGK